MIELWFDGYYENSNSGIGIVIKQDGKVRHTISDKLTKTAMSSNVAEYEALKRGLEYLISNNLHTAKVAVYGDSKLVIMQMANRWRVIQGLYKDIALKTKGHAGVFNDISFYWIPREKNIVADKLSRRVYENVNTN